MRARPAAALAGIPLVVAACESRTGEEFAERARQAIAGWEATPKGELWGSGFVPLEEPTVLPRDPGFTMETKIAYRVGAYRLTGRLPSRAPRQGVIRWPGGESLRVPLAGARQAYKALDKGPMTRTVPGKGGRLPGGAVRGGGRRVGRALSGVRSQRDGGPPGDGADEPWRRPGPGVVVRGGRAEQPSGTGGRDADGGRGTPAAASGPWWHERRDRVVTANAHLCLRAAGMAGYR
jgi:hypothetical protein